MGLTSRAVEIRVNSLKVRLRNPRRLRRRVGYVMPVFSDRSCMVTFLMISALLMRLAIWVSVSASSTGGGLLMW